MAIVVAIISDLHHTLICSGVLSLLWYCWLGDWQDVDLQQFKRFFYRDLCLP